MRKQDYAWLLALTALGAFIWGRDTRWVAAAGDLLPILAGIPLFVWLRWPIRIKEGGTAVPGGQLLGVALLFAAGVLTNSSLVLTFGWCLLLWAWFSTRVVEGGNATTRRLMVLPFFSFPWIVTDFERLGWWFRLSGATAVEKFVALGNVEVARNGTFLLVDGAPLSVEPACSGLNGLQSLLIAGSMVAFITMKRSPLYWVALLALPLAAWFANFLRILSGAGVLLGFEPESAARWVGPLHSAAGWLALGAMFGLCWMLFSKLEHLGPGVAGQGLAWLRQAPVLEFVIIGYAAWRCHGLLKAWFTAPFDQLGWLAFAVWILPLGVDAARGGLPAAGSGRRRPWCLAAGVACLFLGDAGEVNAVTYLGLALILIGFAYPEGRKGWALGAIAWMPALGWLASRFGIEPALAGVGRVAIAMGSCAWWLAARQSDGRAVALDYVGTIKTGP